jgi:glyoxylase-like metal-dependent hydrolase (beta-lactamase superfamily II)
MTTQRLLIAAASLASCLMASVARAQFGAAPAELDLVKVRDDVYVIHNEAVPGNVTALISEQGVLLVDNKFAIDYENMMELLRTVTDQPVVYTIDTHYHDDHSGSNALLQAGDAKVFAAENARIKMIESGRTEGLPDVTIDDYVRIYLGDTPVDIYYFGRSHTDGDIVVHFPEHGIISMGDMYTHGEGLPQLIDYPGGGSARAWTSTVDGVLRLDFETVVPGHGVVATRADLERFRGTTLRLQQMTHEMLQQNRTRDEVATMLRNEFGFQDFHVQASLDGLLVEMR